MRLHSLSVIMALAIFACLKCAHADAVTQPGGKPSLEEFSLAFAKPTIGSIDCLRAAGVMSPACPHEPASPDRAHNAASHDVGTYRVLRLLANEHLYERFHFLKPYDPDKARAQPRGGFSANMIMSYPGTNMYLNLQDLSVEWRLLGGTVRPFNNDDPYAVMRFSWRW